MDTSRSLAPKQQQLPPVVLHYFIFIAVSNPFIIDSSAFFLFYYPSCSKLYHFVSWLMFIAPCNRSDPSVNPPFTNRCSTPFSTASDVSRSISMLLFILIFSSSFFLVGTIEALSVRSRTLSNARLSLSSMSSCASSVAEKPTFWREQPSVNKSVQLGCTSAFREMQLFCDLWPATTASQTHTFLHNPLLLPLVLFCSSTFFLAYQKVGRCHAGTGSNEKRLAGVRARFQRCISSSGFVIATTIALLVPSGATSSNTAVFSLTSGTASSTALARRRGNRIFRHGNARTTLQDSKHVGRFSSGWCDW